MISKELQDERSSKKEIGIKDFNLLSADGTIGFYKECELTHIYILESGSGNLHHYFALLSYEEFEEVDKTLKDIHLTDSLVKINKKYKLGISQMRITKENAKDIFNRLCSGSLKFNNATFLLPKNMQLLPKTHIPTIWGFNGVMLNKVLKPNFWGDKYILEFAGLENPMNEIFTAAELKTINAEILNVIPVDLASVYDRIGSFVFQYPITLISGDAGISDDWCKALISMTMHPGLNYQGDLCSLVKTSLDDVVTGFHSYDGAFENIELDLGDSNNLELKIFNRRNGLIYKSSMVNFIRSINSSFGIGSQNSEPRIFIDSDGNRKEIQLLSFSMAATTGKSVYYDTRTNKRIYHNEIISKSGRFLNLHAGEREKALEFVRKRINEKAPSCSEIWLWDPFLRQADIFDTLYFVGNRDIVMKCITSFKKNKRQEEETRSYVEYKQKEKESFFKNSENNFGVNLELRAVHDNFGFDFHDRFLFLIPKESDEIPTVFSLGTSINSLGKTHHLIQQTLDPRNIIETFKELWTLLDDEESIIIKLPEDNND